MQKVMWMLALVFAVPAHAWHDEGHVYAALAAVEMLPDDVPAFFRQGAQTIAHCSLNPDVNRNEALPQLSAANSPEHFLDAEMLQSRDWPATRYDYGRLCDELDIQPDKAGLLPWAIAERAQALTVALAEYRKEPDNPHVQMRCLVLAGELSHFTADLCMPLHTTIHFDGLVSDVPGQGKRFRGIHARVDALPTKMAFDELFAPLPRGQVAVVPLDQLMVFIKVNFDASHALVGRVYDLEAVIPALPDMALTDQAARDFTVERMNAAADFTATIFLAAWRASADLQLPDWLDRATFDENLDRTRVPPQPGKP